MARNYCGVHPPVYGAVCRNFGRILLYFSPDWMRARSYLSGLTIVVNRFIVVSIPSA